MKEDKFKFNIKISLLPNNLKDVLIKFLLENTFADEGKVYSNWIEDTDFLTYATSLTKEEKEFVYEFIKENAK